MDGVVREINPRTAKGEHYPNDGGPVALRCLRRAKRKLPILGTALRPGRLSHRQAISLLIPPRMRNRQNGKPPALPLDLYLSWMSPFIEVTEPKRYYEDQEEVTLTAHPQEVCTSPDQSQIYTGYRFSHWDGDGFAEDSHSNLVEVAGCPDPTITLTMESDRNVTAIFEVRIIYIIALSGEQWDEPPLPGAQIDSGVLHWAQSLRARNPLMFDLNRFDEDHVAGDGSGLVFDELAMAINNGDAREILMVGHSHGGGAIADLCSRIENDPLYQIGDDEEFSIIMTAYVDAISNETLPYTTAPETAYPALTSHHVNLYQTFDSFLWGAPVTNAVPNWNINNALTCASGIDHEHIDDSAYTHAILTDYALWIICGAGLDTDYCD